MIDTSKLPREAKDRIELKADSEPSFYRATEEDYTDELMAVIAERGRPGSNHSFISSVTGSQGSGKCISENIYLNTCDGSIKMKDVSVGNKVFDESGNFIVIKNKWNEKKDCLKLEFDSEIPVECSMEHKFMTKRGLIKASNLVLEDEILVGVRKISRVGALNDYNRAFFIGAYLADGFAQFSKTKRILISNNDLNYLKYLKKISDACFEFTSSNILVASGKGRYILVCYGNEQIADFLSLCGQDSENKKIPEEIFRTFNGADGLLDGFANSDLTCNMSLAKKGTYKTEVGFMVKSERLGAQLLEVLHLKGFWPNVRIRELKSGQWTNKYVRITFPAKKVLGFLDSLKLVNVSKISVIKKVYLLRIKRKSDDVISSDTTYSLFSGVRLAKIIRIENVGVRACVDLEVESGSHLFQLTGGLITHNSYLSISLCKLLDPNFSIDNIYFDYRDLIYNRQNLTPGTAVLVDEQSEEYGIDSHRINIILGALKEQLRKRSIHFIFCSPTLKEEYKSSIYVLETMYIDFEEKLCYAAYKTRDLLTLGYVKIQHPLNFVSEEFLEAYEKKKDEHLDKLTGTKQVDEIEEIAEKVVTSELFDKAETFYRKKIGYIPASMVVQIINKLYPEFKSSIIVGEVAARIKLNKELEGKWLIPYAEKKKKKRE